MVGNGKLVELGLEFLNHLSTAMTFAHHSMLDCRLFPCPSSHLISMKIALLSDLHVECSELDAAAIDSVGDADMIVLAGDVRDHRHGSPVRWAQTVFAGRDVVFVPGNHDFYGADVTRIVAQWRQQASGSRVVVLDNDTHAIGAVRFIGTPLWSGLSLCGPLKQAFLAWRLKHLVSDFKLMGYGSRAWSTGDMMAAHQRATDFIDQQLGLAASLGETAVVVTHWPPHRLSISPAFRNDPLNPYFINDLPDLVTRAHWWFHGHVHSAFRYRVGDNPTLGRVVCNPRGYVFADGTTENPGPYRATIIDVSR